MLYYHGHVISTLQQIFSYDWVSIPNSKFYSLYPPSSDFTARCMPVKIPCSHQKLWQWESMQRRSNQHARWHTSCPPLLFLSLLIVLLFYNCCYNHTPAWQVMRWRLNVTEHDKLSNHHCTHRLNTAKKVKSILTKKLYVLERKWRLRMLGGSVEIMILSSWRHQRVLIEILVPVIF